MGQALPQVFPPRSTHSNPPQQQLGEVTVQGPTKGAIRKQLSYESNFVTITYK